MQRSCINCRQSFEITDADMAFYDKVSPVIGGKKQAIPPPMQCPRCRQQQRLSFRNERHLYHRKSDMSGRQIIAMYAPGTPHKVYDQDEWWSDRWDGVTYGKEIDFSQSFFPQFGTLMREVPRISLINREHDNSEYCNFSMNNKNSYLLFTSGESQDAFYSNRVWKLTSSADCSNMEEGELCYEVIDSVKCYNCKWLQNCSNCSDCTLGYGLQGCKNCFACYGLKQKSYCIGNVQYGKEEYAKLVANLMQDMPAVRKNFDARKREVPRKYLEGHSNEYSTGDALQNCQNAHQCFEAMNLRDCAYVCNGTFLTDVYDLDNGDRSELVYQVVGDEQNYSYLFGDICWFNRELLYSSLCFNCEKCFGCVGLRQKKHCILNKQYTPEEYEVLVPKLIEHMRKTGEWGEFFPRELSPFGYNQTMAQDYHPLTEAVAREQGWQWQAPEKSGQYLGPTASVPDRIEDTPDDICQKILSCEVSGDHYKITPRELNLYRTLGVPVPKKCFEQRHQDRMAMRNPRKLWDRQCTKCKKAIQTTYAPDRPEIVQCEECYRKTVY